MKKMPGSEHFAHACLSDRNNFKKVANELEKASLRNESFFVLWNN